MTQTGDNGVNAQIKAYVERVERLNAERATISEDVKEVFAEAKNNGLDTKVIKKLIAERKRDRHEVEAELELLELYRRALS